MTNSTPASHQINSVPQENWREQLLQRILIIAAVAGIFAVISAVLSTDDLILQVIYIGAYVTLVASILIRLPYLAKAGLFVALPLILGIASLSETGIRGDSLFFLLTFVTLATLLIGPRSGIASVIITELIIIIMGYLILNDHYTLSDKFSFEGDLSDWISASATQLLISLIILSGLRMLHESFNQALTQNEIMVSTLRESQIELENRVELRTKELARKTDQLSASAFVAHQTAEIQDLEKLLSSAVNAIANQFDLYHAGIYLINERGDYVTLQAASSEGGKQLLVRGHRVKVGAGDMVGLVAAEKEPRVTQNVNEDSTSRNHLVLPETRSELSLPLIVRNKVIGVLDLQSSDAQAFHFDDIAVFQTLADQIAVALENARLLSESQRVISQFEITAGEEILRNWKMETASQKPAYHYSATGLRSLTEPMPLKGQNVLEIPLIVRGKKIGKICLQRKDEHKNWTPQEETVANEVATQTALALENVRLVEHAKLRVDREQAFSEITKKISAATEFDDIMRETVSLLGETLEDSDVTLRIKTQWD